MVTAKTITLFIHNLLRWAIVVSALYTLFRLYSGAGSRNKPGRNPIARRSTIFTILLDTQLLVGFLLYFVFSDLVKAAFANMAAAMGNQITALLYCRTLPDDGPRHCSRPYRRLSREKGSSRSRQIQTNRHLDHDRIFLLIARWDPLDIQTIDPWFLVKISRNINLK